MTEARSTPLPAAPKVTIVIIVYRRTEFIASAVRSALEQTYPKEGVEILLVGNRIEEDAARRFEVEGVRVHRSTLEPLGEKIAYGISAARGEIVSFLEDDDRFEREKVSEVVRRFDADPDLVYYHNNFTLIGSDEAPYPHPFHRAGAARRIERLGSIRRPKQASPGGWGRFLGTFPGFNDSCISVRRAAFEPWVSHVARSGLVTDECLFLAAAATGGAILQDAARLTRIMVHQDSISRPTTAGRPADAREMRIYSQRALTDLGSLLELARSTGREDLIRGAEAELAVQRVVGLLRDPASGRREVLQPFATALRRPETLAVRNFPAVLALGGAAVLSPSAARGAYRAARRLMG